MDVTFSNVLEGTRQYFMGLPKQAQAEGSGQTVWPGGAPPHEEGAPAQSGAPAPSSRPPSAAAAPPPRPPSEPLEPEPHIIHKATVMREAAEKRRERPEPDDDVEPAGALSPPSHIIRKPPPRALPSPAPAPAAPCPSPARPPSAAPLQPPPAPEPQIDSQYRPPVHRVQTPTARPPDHFAPGRPPDPYSVCRPPESYTRYHYESNLPDGGRNSHGPPAVSPQPSVHPRQSPQTYARLSSSLPQHTTSRLREAAAQSPPGQRYVMPPAQPPPPLNDRVPPIHHPQALQPQRVNPGEARSAQYPHPSMTQRREPSPYSRVPSHYERHPALPQRKYDPQQAYPGYRPTPTGPQTGQNHHRVDMHHHVQYKQPSIETGSAQYATRPLDHHVPAPSQAYSHDPRSSHDSSRRLDYNNLTHMSRSVDARSSYHYTTTPSTSSVRYAPNTPSAPVPVVQSSTVPRRDVQRPATTPKTNYDYVPPNQVQTSPARSTVKPGYPNQQARMTVSVTTLVNQMNQTKQKRESPLDLSVKTVKNSADSSTTQDDVIDSVTMENKNVQLQPRPTSSNILAPVGLGLPESHKVDFAPDFAQYRERGTANAYTPTVPPGHHPVRFNGNYEAPRPVADAYSVESRHHGYSDRSKYPVPLARADYVPRIDLTRSTVDERRPENRIRDDRHFIIEERKRPAGPIVSNIPEKIVRYETWTADSRIDRINQSVREQRELMSQPVYSYSSHKQFEAYQNEQKRATSSNAYREHHSHANLRYPYSAEPPVRERIDYQTSYRSNDRNPSSNNRHVIQKIPSHRDMHLHNLDPHSGVPADKRVLSILRNSLETKQIGFVEPARPARQIPDLIVIDDVDDSVIEITDLTKDTDADAASKNVTNQRHKQIVPNLSNHIQMPKAVDSISGESDYAKLDNSKPKSKSPENDVASRIRTKAELKGIPPSQDSSVRSDIKRDCCSENNNIKILPKSQKQHLFNQLREDSLRLESSILKSESSSEIVIPEVKTEPMNIDEIEKDATLPIKIENIFEPLECENIDASKSAEEDLDWASACDSFMEQLKTGCHKKKTNRKRVETLDHDNENRISKIPKAEPIETTTEKVAEPSTTTKDLVEPSTVIIKQEPVDEDEICSRNEPSTSYAIDSNRGTCIEKTQSETNESVNVLQSKDTEKDKTLTNKESKEKALIKSTSSVSVKIKKEQNKIIKKNKRSLVQKEKVQTEKNVDTPKKSLTSEKEKAQNEKEKNVDTTKKSSTPENEKIHTEKENKVDTPKKSLTPEKGKIQTEKEKNVDTPKKSLTPSNDKDKCQTKTKKSLILNEKERKRKTSIINDQRNKEQGKTRKSNVQEATDKSKPLGKNEINKCVKIDKTNVKSIKGKSPLKPKVKIEKNDSLSSTSTAATKKDVKEKEPLKTIIKEELESTDDDEPLINSKIMKEKEMKYQLLKDLSEKSAYVKLECFDVDMNKNTRISIDSLTKEKEEKLSKGKITRKTPRTKGKSLSIENNKVVSNKKGDDSSSNSDDEDLTVASRLRLRKSIKTEDNKTVSVSKTPVKSSSSKKQDINSASSTPIRKPGFGDGSDFHPGWEEELYRYKRSLRMPTRLIAIPRGRSGGPFIRGTGGLFTRGSTSLPDLDPAPLSPAPSSAPSAATDDLYTRRPDKLTLDSDLESNSSSSAVNRLHYDSEASTSTVFSSSKVKKKSSSIVDVLIQKCGKRDDSRKKFKDKDKDEKSPKIIPKSTNVNELLATPGLGLMKNGDKSSLSAKKEKLMEDIFYLGAFRKETVTAFRNAFIKNTDGLIGATEEFAPVVLKTRTRTESRVLKQRATIKEVFGDERPASAPPTSCREEDELLDTKEHVLDVKKEPESEQGMKPEPKQKLELQEKPQPELEPEKSRVKIKNIIKDKVKRRSSSIRDGLRSTKSLKRNDAKGRLLRLKKRNSLMKSLNTKRLKDVTVNKIKKEKLDDSTEDKDKDKPKEEGSSLGEVEGSAKRRLKRLFGRRKFSSGFDYIRKKKKIIRREGTPNNRIRRPAVKPSPESVHDIQKEIKGWFINKSIGETHLHRAARLGYTDCVAYCLEKMEAEPSAKDNAGFTPLHVAAAKGHVRIARLLLQYGANVSAAAQGGIRPLHEACENCHVEIIRLLLAYGADPLLGTYAGQMPEELTEGPAAKFLRLYIADIQGHNAEPWRFPPLGDIIDREELGCDPLSSPPPASPPPPPDAVVEMQCTEAPLPPFYSLKPAPGQPSDGLWCLLQDITNLLQIKSKDSLLKQIHCGSGSPKELLREIRTQEFLERAQCHQLLCAGEKVNVRASKVALVRVTDKLRQLLKIETVLIS